MGLAGTGQFSLSPLEADDPQAPARGTAIRLKLRDESRNISSPTASKPSSRPIPTHQLSHRTACVTARRAEPRS